MHMMISARGMDATMSHMKDMDLKYIARLTDKRMSIALPLRSWPVFATAAISILEEDISDAMK